MNKIREMDSEHVSTGINISMMKSKKWEYERERVPGCWATRAGTIREGLCEDVNFELTCMIRRRQYYTLSRSIK